MIMKMISVSDFFPTTEHRVYMVRESYTKMKSVSGGNAKTSCVGRMMIDGVGSVERSGGVGAGV